MNFQDIFNLTDIDEGVPCQPARQVGPYTDLSLGYGVRIRFLMSIGPKSKQIILRNINDTYYAIIALHVSCMLIFDWPMKITDCTICNDDPCIL
jgi:hypothetical protein